MKSRLRSISLLIASSLLFSGCVAGVQVRESPNAGDPVADKPTYCVGDRWMNIAYSKTNGKDNWEMKVVEVNGDGSYVVESTSETDHRRYSKHYDENFQLIKEINLETGELEPIPVSPIKRLDFPLFVGKRWTDEYFGSSIDGNEYLYKNTYTVTAFEKVLLRCLNIGVMPRNGQVDV